MPARRIPKCEQRPEWTQRREQAEVILDLPLCPPTNNLYFNNPGIGRSKTRAYRSWISAAVLYGNVQRPARIVGRCDVVIHLSKFRGDTDGRFKALIDAAKTIGVIADDSGRYVRNVQGIREDKAPAGFVRIVLTRIPDAADAAQEAA